MDIKLFNAEWGSLDFCVDFNKIDILPRITMSSIHGAFFLNIGFLMLTFNLCVFSKEMREFNRKIQSGEMAKEFEEHIREHIRVMEEREQEKHDTIRHISEVVDEIMLQLKEQKSSRPRKRTRVVEQ